MSCSGNCCKQEFTKKNFTFDYDDPEVFGKSQWGSPSIFYLLFWRWPMFIFFVVVIVFSILNNLEIRDLPWPVFVTNWGVAILTVSCLMEAIAASYHLARVNQGKEETTSMPLIYKISWFFYNSTNAIALLITIIYWALLYEGETIIFYNLGVHALNSVYVIMNIFISGHPTRFLHIYHPVIFAACWVIMSGIYYAASGNIIYGIYDFRNNPVSASLIGLAIAFIATPFFHIVAFGLYKLRMVIYESCSKRKQVAPNDAEAMQVTEHLGTVKAQGAGHLGPYIITQNTLGNWTGHFGPTARYNGQYNSAQWTGQHRTVYLLYIG